MHYEAADLYELCGARAPGPPGPPVPDGAPAPCPAKPDPSDNKRRFCSLQSIGGVLNFQGGYITLALTVPVFY